MAKILTETSGYFASTAPILKDDELAYEIDTGAIRIGDGGTAYASLPSLSGPQMQALNLVIASTSGTGIKVDSANPVFGWRDLEGVEIVDTIGANAATLSTYQGDIREFAFGVGDLMETRFHMPHDYAPGTDMFIHVHWSHVGTAISGTFEPHIHHSYAKGHGQAPFSAPKQLILPYATVDIATTPQFQHMITEVPLSVAGGSATQLDSADLEIDGLILCQIHVDAIPTITGGTSNLPFIHRVDIHYQSTNMATADKAPDFYVQ